MCGMQACVIANVPRELMLVMRSYFFIGVSTMSCHQSALALLTRTARRHAHAVSAGWQGAHGGGNGRCAAVVAAAGAHCQSDQTSS